MRGNYKSPSELLLALRETGKSYWDLVGKPLTPNTGYSLNNPHAAEESEYNKWYNGSKLSDEDSEKLQLLLEEYDKDVKSNSNSLPSYKGGKDKFTTFVERMGPKVYRQLHKQGIYNPYIYDNMMRLLAWESDYGTSPLAISNHNYGGVKSSNTEYAKYKDDDAFANYYVSLIRRKYPQAVKAKDARSYARELKKVGYYEDSLQNYSQKLSDMSSVSRAAKLHMHTNPKQYEVEVLLDDLKKQAVQQPVSTRVEAPINKEPINKEPFVNTPIPTKAPLITRPEYLESNSLIKKSFELNMDNMLLGKEFLFKLPGFRGGKDGNLSSTYPLGRRYWQALSNTPTILEKKNTWVKQQKTIKDRKDKALRKWLKTEGVKELNKEVKDYLTTSNDNTWTAANRNPKNPHLQDRVTKGAKAHASWEKEHPVLNTWGNVLGAVPFAVASAPLVAAAGSGMAALGDAVAATSAGQAITAGLAPLATAASTNIAGAPLYTWADVGLSSLFGAHGIQTAINEGGISPETALEIAPLGRLSRPILNKAATAIENYRYPIGRPQVPENFLTVKPQVRTKVGDVEVNTPNMAYRQGNDLGRTYQKYKDVDASIAQHQIEDNLEQLQFAKHGKPYINREAALDKAIAEGAFDPAVGIEVNGHPAAFQDTPMYADGYLWYGTPKINEVLRPGSLQSGLLVTPKNDAFIIGSNKATPYKGTGSGVVKSKSGITTVTDNGGRLIPADTGNLGLELNNVSAYTWEPGYGYRKVIAEETPTIKWRDAAKPPQITAENAASTTPEVTHFYHGSPVRFDAFSADFIGSGEGGSKVMRGINLWPTEKIANAPKLANIKSPDAPLHLGVPSTPLGGELNPTVYDVSGKGLKLYKASPREVKGLNQSDLISKGYDGVQTPNQVTVFPESIGKLSIDKQSTIEEFVRAHPEVEKWTPWTTDTQKMQNIIDISKMSKWTPEQWTAAQDAAIAKGDMTEAQRLRDLHFIVSAPNTIAKTKYAPLRLFHGTKNKFNSFDLDLFGSTDGGVFGRGIYTTPSEFYASLYGENVMPLYMKLDNPRKLSYDALSEVPFLEEKTAFGPDFATGNGIDGVYGTTKFKQHEGAPEYVSHKPNNIKSADAVTYDDNGVRIPLGKRDNFKLNDIRYGLIPFGAGLTGYGLLNNHKTSIGSTRNGNTKK